MPLNQINIKRKRFTITGAVQGVGYRPFIFRVAKSLNVNGWVKNTNQGLIIEVESTQSNLDDFENRLYKDKPPQAIIDKINIQDAIVQNVSSFEIIISEETDTKNVSILPDLSTCDACLGELKDSSNFRYRYPFINCTNCGPRYSIIERLPYDRCNTTMKDFELCQKCKSEYLDPINRRFHAQPVACPECGPHLELVNNNGKLLSTHEAALLQTLEELKDGKIIACKGIGGFHLLADASNSQTITKLRKRKNRPSKPFALMYPSIDTVSEDCFISEEERNILTSAYAPIVLLKHKTPKTISLKVAPKNPFFGVMLPYTPLHHLILDGFSKPIIATSGNRANEPICTENEDAMTQLKDIADLFLIHNRPISNRVEDSIVCVIKGQEMVMRRGRGYSPLPVKLPKKIQTATLAVGGHLKNAIAYAIEDKMILSSHIGELDSVRAIKSLEKTAKALPSLYENHPEVIAHDLHPDYASTYFAKNQHADKIIAVQHHYAHALSCMIDNNTSPPCFAVVWDGIGLGEGLASNLMWGGEFLKITENGYKRSFHLNTFPLQGGEAAIKEPKRAAFGILYSLQNHGYSQLNFSEEQSTAIHTSIKNNLNTYYTSSIGRLFDAVSSLIGICDINSFEGEAAMLLEFQAMRSNSDEHYDFSIHGDIVDWRPMIKQILNGNLENKADIAKRFHNTLVKIILEVCHLQECQKVILSGGCFQNKLLLESVIDALKIDGFEPYWHHKIPSNDGGLCAGQIYEVLRQEA